MTNNLPLLAIMVGTTMFAIIGAYIGWRSYRVYLLRLELLTIRNRLWDVAHDVGMFDNDEYRLCRRNLNLMVRYAHRIDSITLAFAPTPDSKKSTATAEAMPEVLTDAISTAITDAGCELHRYIIWDRPFTGILLFKCVDLMAFLFRTLKFVRRMAKGYPKDSAAKVRSFSGQSKQNAVKWIKEDGPSYAFAAGALVTTVINTPAG